MDAKTQICAYCGRRIFEKDLHDAFGKPTGRMHWVHESPHGYDHVATPREEAKT